jgi:Flp pilus assembly pilin Flp
MFGLQDHDLGEGTGVCNSNLTRRLHMTFLQFISKLHREESGQDTVEYVLIGAAVVTALVAGSPTLTAMLQAAITALQTKVTAAIG